MPVLLLAFMLGATAADNLAPYRGHPVLSLEIQAPKDENPKELRSLVDIQKGYLLRTDDIQTSVKRLYSLGRFSSVSVFAKRRQGTVQLTFQLTPLQHIEKITFEGLKQVKSNALIKALPVSPNDEFNSKTLPQIEERLLKHLHRLGYPDATLRAFHSQGTSYNRVRIRVEIEENAPTRIHTIAFEGATRLSPQHLAAFIQSREGGILNELLLRQDHKSLIQHYLSRDFRTVQIPPPTLTSTPQGTDVVFNINAGNRIALQFTGNRLLSRQTLVDLWPDASGRLRKGDLRTFQNRISSYYRQAGYPDTEVSLTGYHDQKGGIMRYLFQLKEGKAMQVGKITFTGNKAIPAHILREHIHSRLEQSFQSDELLQTIDTTDRQSIRFGDSRPEYSFGEVPSNTAPRIPSHRRWVREIYEDSLYELVAVYKDRGFLNAKVGPLQKTYKDDVLHIHVPIEEGVQTFIQSITFQHNFGIESSKLLTTLENSADFKLGAPLSHSRIEDARIALIRSYRDEGYIYARIFTSRALSSAGTAADIVFLFEEGPQVRLDRILIRGNDFTHEGLIRSRLKLKPGQPYRLHEALDSQRAVSSLGVFSSVKLRLIDEETPGERKDLIAQVNELQRHRIETVGGISTEDGPRLGLSYSHLNLFGTASTLTSSAKLNRQLPALFRFLYGSQGNSLQQRYDNYTSTTDQLTKALERELRLGVRSPQFVGLPLTPLLRLDVTDLRDNKTSYSLDATAATFGVEFFFGRHLKIDMGPQISLTRVECTSPLANCGEQVQQDTQSTRKVNQGSRVGLNLGSTLTYDLRNSPFNPTKGFILSLSGQYALGAFTADPTQVKVLNQFEEPSYVFTKVESRMTAYLPLGKSVLALALWGGTISMMKGELDDTPLDERFFLGGRSDLRGFQEESLIPEDACYQRGATNPDCKLKLPAVEQNKDGDPALSAFPSLGGNFYALAKAELRLPITQLLSLDLFVDAGNLWMYRPEQEYLKLRFGTGLGISLATPVGPLSFSVGFNPQWRASNLESPVEYYFSIGQF
ncbi:MAG: POTRA domain-containing protein [Myxococcota bacterium]|nr:POTRA domain-containing protein [Myxococcota bacterium]